MDKIEKGQRFGKLVVISDQESVQCVKHKGTVIMFLCKCDCVKEKKVCKRYLLESRCPSCGCEKYPRPGIHNLSGTRFYGIYKNVCNRCGNKNEKCYKNYGGRGIKCLWDCFEEFNKDMYHSYLEHCKLYGEKNTTIDRIDNNGNYCKENCQRSDRFVQNSNTRKNVYYKGKHIAQWCRDLGINKNTVNVRRLRGMTIEEALFTPLPHKPFNLNVIE